MLLRMGTLGRRERREGEAGKHFYHGAYRDRDGLGPNIINLDIDNESVTV